MSGGSHKVYTVYVYQREEGEDISDKIKLAVNVALGTAGNVNKVEEKEEE